MQRILVALVISYVIVISAAMALGFWVHDAPSFALHFALGMFSTLLTCLIYCVLLTYFVITGKMIKQAVLKAHLDHDLIRQSQRPKSWIVRLTALGVAVTIAAALLGAWANVSADPAAPRVAYHMIAECFAVICNLAAFGVCYQLTCKNARLADHVFGQVDGRPRAGTSSPPEP